LGSARLLPLLSAAGKNYKEKIRKIKEKEGPTFHAGGKQIPPSKGTKSLLV